MTAPAGSPVDLTTPEASTLVQPPDTVSVDGAVASPLFSPDGCPDCKKCESVFANVPPPIIFPRLGGFFILPTGPGYYSLKDVCTGECREKPPVYPYPPFLLDVVPFYDNNFRYLDDPNNTQHDFLDPIKRIHLGDDWLLSFGGEERIRYADEFDSRLSGKTNMYELERSRIYGDLWFRDVFRVYAEYGYVEASNEQLPPAATDIDKDDIINLFVDLKLFELDDHPVYVRGGRQELNYGSQRLISQTDFPNAPRTFDGIKGFWHSDNLDVDAFMTRPVVIDPDHFNSENDKSTFDGLWATYRPMKGQAVDLYYLYLDTDTPLAAAPPPPGSRGGFDVNTFGSRYAGDYNYLVWDFEGMYQFGEHGAQTTSAGAYTTGAGLHFANAPMNPIFWVVLRLRLGQPRPRPRRLRHVQSAVSERPQLLRLDGLGGAAEHRRRELPNLVLPDQMDRHGRAVPHPAARQRQGRPLQRRRRRGTRGSDRQVRHGRGRGTDRHCELPPQPALGFHDSVLAL